MVTVLIACAFYVLACIVCAMALPDAAHNNADLILLFCIIPCVILIILASIKRCHDIGEDGLYIFKAFTHFKLDCKEGDEGLNAYGSEPLEPYDEQIAWQEDV